MCPMVTSPASISLLNSYKIPYVLVLQACWSSTTAHTIGASFDKDLFCFYTNACSNLRQALQVGLPLGEQEAGHEHEWSRPACWWLIPVSTGVQVCGNIAAGFRTSRFTIIYRSTQL